MRVFRHLLRLARHCGFVLPMLWSAHLAAATRHTDSRTDTSAWLWLSDRARFEAPELYLGLLSGLPQPSPRPLLRLVALSKCPPWLLAPFEIVQINATMRD